MSLDQMNSSNESKVLSRFLKPILLIILFTFAYSPGFVFSSNQNQYFLHGLANANFGNLRDDWFVSTTDLKPLFSSLVEITYQLTSSKNIFYIYYTLILGIYLFCVYSIASKLLHQEQQRSKKWVFISLVFITHSAALRYALTSSLGNSWGYLFDGGFASQRILGSVFQPASFGVLLLLAVYFFLNNKPYLSAIFASIACIFDPSIIHVSAALVLSFVVIIYFEERNYRKSILVGLTSLAIVAPMIIYLFGVVTPTSSEISIFANDVLVNFRNPHHANPAVWFDITSIIKFVIILLAMYVIRKSRMVWLLIIPAASMLILTLAQIFLNSDQLALMYPWRISVFLVPLSTAILLGHLVNLIFNKWKGQIEQFMHQINISLYLIVLALAIVGGYAFYAEYNDRINSNEQQIFNYIDNYKQPGQIYMIPINMENFRLETGAAAFVDFKSVPTKDIDVVDWIARIRQVEIFTRRSSTVDTCYQLERLNIEYGVTHAIQSTDIPEVQCDNVVEKYRDNNFLMYEILEKK